MSGFGKPPFGCRLRNQNAVLQAEFQFGQARIVDADVGYQLFDSRFEGCRFRLGQVQIALERCFDCCTANFAAPVGIRQDDEGKAVVRRDDKLGDLAVGAAAVTEGCTPRRRP